MCDLAIVGSRTYQHLDWVRYYIWTMLPFIDVLISGGAEGVDQVAYSAAQRYEILTIVHAADWLFWGPSAGPRRNTLIVAEADAVVAFWDGKSKGTLDTINKARSAGKLVAVYKKPYANVWDRARARFNVYSR